MAARTGLCAGEGWGFFILDVFLVMMCADILVLTMAAVFPVPSVQLTGTTRSTCHPAGSCCCCMSQDATVV